jgi:hypothetical protein
MIHLLIKNKNNYTLLSAVDGGKSASSSSSATSSSVTTVDGDGSGSSSSSSSSSDTQNGFDVCIF